MDQSTVPSGAPKRDSLLTQAVNILREAVELNDRLGSINASISGSDSTDKGLNPEPTGVSQIMLCVSTELRSLQSQVCELHEQIIG